MLIPGDLVTDLDLLAIDVEASQEFGGSSLAEKRRVAVTGWLRPRLEAAGLPPAKHLTRRNPDVAYGTTGGVVSDLTTALGTRADDDTALAGVLATPGSDYLVVGMHLPFRGLFVAMSDSVNANACAASITYWNGKWTALSSLVDGTAAVSGKSFSGGGRIAWSLPDDWIERPLRNAEGVSTHVYAVRIQINSPVGGHVAQVLPLAFSRLTNAAAMHAVGMLYRESIGSNRGSDAYEKKAGMFLEAADRELETVMPLIVDEFDIDRSGSVEATEAQSVVNIDHLTTWERG
jgi:hypothetical protein